MRVLLLASILTLACGPALAAAPGGTAARIIAKLHMQKIPDEGAWFAGTYQSPIRIPQSALPARYDSARNLGSGIYALITRDDFSAMHRLLTDETWHFYSGDPIELLLLYPDGRNRIVTLGSDVLAGQQPQFTVPAGVWMGARPQGNDANAYALFGCTLAPGFDYGDYQAGYRDVLQAAYPQRAALIAALTREAFAKAPPDAAPSPSSSAVTEAIAPFSVDDVPAVTVAPGVTLRELIGRNAHAKRNDYSLAHFRLAPGKSTGMSYNRTAEEFFVVTGGRGTAMVDGRRTPVTDGSVVILKPGERHALDADANHDLVFYAITVPAFSPDDYVRVEAAER
ncbi:cupin domain-containing protein [Solimonas marina]|uniref:Cupin domain-containing protein n=1 Tax=Solimonas marina TaxID=2714601 RepID=A0A969WA57_9GAMM|nr:cupin domain-containing protein [Solimonas marina]NKF23187.1 cupin domain-containing protein [Solimonas marina]